MVLELGEGVKKKRHKNKYKEYHCKQALIHTVAVVSRGGGWNSVRQQNERADTVEKAAAKENEASVQ